MKRILRVLVLSLMLIFGINEVNASGSCLISGNVAEEIKAGEEVLVDFYYSEDSDTNLINGGSLFLHYTASAFEFIGIENVYDGVNVSKQASDNSLKLDFSISDTSKYIKSNGQKIVLASIRFKVKNGVSNQVASIEMMGLGVSYLNYSDGNKLQCLGTESYAIQYNIYSDKADATLANLTISDGELSPGFSKYVYEYKVSVPYNIEAIKFNAKATASGATVSDNGSVHNLVFGKNTFEIKVTSEDKTAVNTYKIVVTREEDASTSVNSDDSSLKSLTVNEGELSPEFAKDVFDYTVEVENEIDKIRLSAVCAGRNCTVKGTGTKYLDEGENGYTIEVVAEDGNVSKYNVTVNRKKAIYLTSILIDGYSLSPSFDKEILEYKVEVPDLVDKLDIRVEANNEDATIEVIGNEEFEEGRNIVQILVKSDDLEKIYTIIVDKAEEKELVSGPVGTFDDDVHDNSYVLWIAIILGILIFGGIILYVYLKNKGKKKVISNNQVQEETDSFNVEEVLEEQKLNDVDTNSDNIDDDNNEKEV